MQDTKMKKPRRVCLPAKLVPLLVLLQPATRTVPPLYRWRVRSRIYRRYGGPMAMERDMLGKLSPGQREQILKRRDDIEESVNDIKTPLSFAGQLCAQREHISLVRHRRDLEPGH